MLALAEGGVDLLLLETIFDTLNAKAAIAAARESVPDLPLWISATIVDRSGRMLSGQTIEAFWTSIEHAEPLIVGINCSLGAHEMRSYVADLAHVAPCLVSAHPNAGLPNAFGGYDETPEITSSAPARVRRGGLPERGRQLLRLGPGAHRGDRRRGAGPRAAPGAAECAHATRWSGLEPFEIGPDTGFVLIGERTNVTGSARFRRARRVRRLRRRGRGRARAGARRGERARREHGRRPARERRGDAHVPDVIATEPEVARLPVMVDSSRWSVIEAGLQSIQGKGIVNSISLKEGEEPFLEQARRIRDYGASVVVMAFDEEGQATDVERRVAICGRAYDLLTARGGLPARGPDLRPERARGRDRDRGARHLRARLPRGAAADQGALPRLAHERRHLEPELLVPRQRRAPRGDARRVPLPRDPRRASTWGSSTRASSRSTRTSSPSCSSGSRT